MAYQLLPPRKPGEEEMNQRIIQETKQMMEAGKQVTKSIITYHPQSKGKKGWFDVVDPGYDTIEEAIDDITTWPISYKDRDFRVVRRTMTEDIVYTQSIPNDPIPTK